MGRQQPAPEIRPSVRLTVSVGVKHDDDVPSSHPRIRAMITVSAVSRSQLVGVARLFPFRGSPDCAEVADVWVREDMRRLGIGRRVVTRAIGEARRRGVVDLWLWTTSRDLVAWYASLGFETVSTHIPARMRRARLQRKWAWIEVRQLDIVVMHRRVVRE